MVRALMNQAIHNVDLLTWLMGPVVEITAQADMLAHKRIEVEDVVVATLRFANGALGVIEATTAAFPGALKRLKFTVRPVLLQLKKKTLLPGNSPK